MPMSKKKIVFFKDFVNSDWGKVPNQSTGLMATIRPLTKDDEYVACVQKITLQMNAILAMDIDIKAFAGKTPEHFDKYLEIMSTVRNDAASMLKLIAYQLCTLPKNELETLNDFDDYLNRAIGIVENLIEDPEDAVAKRQLKQVFEKTSATLGYIIEDTQKLIEKLEKQQESLENQASKLCEIANLMMKDKQADEAKLKELNESMDKMRREIDSLTNTIIGLAIADALLITMSVLACVFLGPIGALTWIPTGAGIIVATSYIVIDAAKISQLKAEVEAKAIDAGAYTTAIAALVNYAKKCKEEAEKTRQLKEAMQVLIGEWEKVKSCCADINTELQNASDWDSQTWTEVKEELQAAQKKESALRQQLEKLNISLPNVVNKPIPAGLDAEQTKKFVEEVGVTPLDKIVA